VTRRVGSAGRSTLETAALLRRAVRDLDQLTVPELIELRDRAEELLRRERLTPADARDVVQRLPSD